jgi:hypothetical protein
MLKLLYWYLRTFIEQPDIKNSSSLEKIYKPFTSCLGVVHVPFSVLVSNFLFLLCESFVEPNSFATKQENVKC